jgi:O-antigen/teichoic acid export membrane protein
MLSTPKFKWNSDIFRICAALVAIDLVTALYFRSDVLIMAALGRSKEEIGIYSALTRIIEAYIFLVAPVAVTFFRSARMGLNDQKSTARTLWRLSAIVGAPTLVLLALTTEYNDWMVHLIFGSQFQSGATYLAWLIAACCATAPNALLGQCLLASNRERYFLSAVLGALAVNLSLNMTLIATRGATGAAQATFATELSLLFFLTIAFYAPMRKSVMASPKC